MAYFALLVVLIILFTTWTIFVAIDRLFFYPLADIPGPRLAALTYLYETYYDVVRPGLYDFKIKELHEQYGELPRHIFPDLLAIDDTVIQGPIYALTHKSFISATWIS